MVFSCRAAGIDHRFVDVSRCALEGEGFPETLGLRPQAMPLKPVTPESQGRFLAPTLSRRCLLEQFGAPRSAAEQADLYWRAPIGESLSLIYAPVYRKERVYDAVLQRPLAGVPENLDLERLNAGPPQGHLRFVPAICPQCGWDLEGRSDSLVLLCRHCQRAWQARRRGLEKIPIAHLPRPSDASLHLPFWRIRAAVQGLPLASHADLVRLANLPRVVRAAWETDPFRFWFPAFKIRPKSMLHLARSLTLGQPAATLAERLPPGEIFPVNLPLEEAVESLKILLAAFAKPYHQIRSRLAQIRITPQAMLLVYIPFYATAHEYLQPDWHLSLNRRHLSLD
jgi:hypothetical protein